MKPFFEARGAQGIVGARSGRASGGTPEKPGFLRLCRKKCARMITVFILEPAQLKGIYRQNVTGPLKAMLPRKIDAFCASFRTVWGGARY
jgi:hypothetical protein